MNQLIGVQSSHIDELTNYLFDDQVVLADPDIEVLLDAVGRREDPARCNESPAAEHLLVLVQNGHLPRPVTSDGLTTSYRKKQEKKTKLET